MMTYAQRSEFAERIGLFLVGEGLSLFGQWHGRLTKQQQLDEFGVYFGDGPLHVCGETNSIHMIVPIDYGNEYENRRGINAQTGHVWDKQNASQFAQYFRNEGILVN